MTPSDSPTLPTHLSASETAARLREDADRRIDGRLRVLPSDAGVTCRAGCSACCHQLVVVSPLEAHALAEYVARDPELAQAVEDRLADWRGRMQADAQLFAHLEQFEHARGYLPSEAGGELEVEYWQAHLPCPFLHAGSCSVYPVRPFACREHHVISDPLLCAEDLDRVTPADTRMEFRAVANWTGSECFGMPDRLVLLARALEYAADRPEEAAAEAPEAEVQTVIELAQRRARVALARLKFEARTSG